MTESLDARVGEAIPVSTPKPALLPVPDNLGDIAPIQFYDLCRRNLYFDGETRLVFAVLEDAVRTYLRQRESRCGAGRAEFCEVARWFEAGSGAPFSFEYVCDVLRIDPVSLRNRLRTLSPDVLPTKQMRSTGRRHQLRATRYVSKCSA